MSADVLVTALVIKRRIEIAWPTPVEWTFEPRGGATFVSIVASGFSGSDDEQGAGALDSNEGFNLVIADCKAYLEHGTALGPGRRQEPADNR